LGIFQRSARNFNNFFFKKFMAKTSGPFMSMAASGTLGKVLTASIWKGNPYMRLRVVPANPKTAGQTATRGILGVLAKASAAVLTSFVDTMDVGSAFFRAARDFAPSGQSWISWFQKTMYPLAAAQRTHYLTLSSTIRGYYDTGAATALLASYTDVAGVTHTSGEQLYYLAYYATIYLGYTMTGGIDAPASATPTTALATWVHVTS
jgi:hypothetical protein